MRSGKCGNFKASRDFKKRLVVQRRYVSWFINMSAVLSGDT